MAEVPQALVQALAARLPRTFAPALNDQLKQWDALFPAEQRGLQAQLNYLTGLPSAEFKDLFAPMVALESRMDLPRLDAGSVRDTGMLARSPLYPRWRGEVEKIFAKMDAEIEKSGVIPRHPRVVLSSIPEGLPITDQPLWPELGSKGFWIRLDRPFGEFLTQFGRTLAARRTPPDLEPVERTWVLECDTRLAPLTESTSATVISWAALDAARREFLDHLNHIRRDLQSVDQTNDQLKRLDLAKLLPPLLAQDRRVREFIRGLLLSGNGSLVFNNSFVQWGSSEALRRVQPQVLMASFGLRPKMKPFSSSVLFEDQKRSNPVADADDPAGSLVDILQLTNYVFYTIERVSAYQGRTLTLMAGCSLDRILAIGGPQPPSVSSRLTPDQFAQFVMRWLDSEGTAATERVPRS